MISSRQLYDLIKANNAKKLFCRSRKHETKVQCFVQCALSSSQTKPSLIVNEHYNVVTRIKTLSDWLDTKLETSLTKICVNFLKFKVKITIYTTERIALLVIVFAFFLS